MPKWMVNASIYRLQIRTIEVVAFKLGGCQTWWLQTWWLPTLVVSQLA